MQTRQICSEQCSFFQAVNRLCEALDDYMVATREFSQATGNIVANARFIHDKCAELEHELPMV